jgi:hypothetical protein
MAELVDQPQTTTASDSDTAPDSDLVSAVRSVLEASSEPLTLSKIRAGLPSQLRAQGPEALAEALRRQVAANVLVQYPKYRSPQDRYWDRPMPVHLQTLLRLTLEEKPLPWSEIRRKLPDYAKTLAEPVLEEQVAKGALFRHPPLNSRTGPRFGISGPDAREYLRPELARVFERLEQMGFTRAELREGAMGLLSEEEWSTPSAAKEEMPVESAGAAHAEESSGLAAAEAAAP